jgi:ribokinase
VKRVLFVGDINVDLIFAGLHGSIQPDREITCSEFSRTMGSSAAITAVAFSLLGGTAGFCGLAGLDDDGRFMIEGLRSRGIDVSLVESSSDVPTGVTLNLIEGRMRSQVTFPGTINRFDGSALKDETLAGWDHVHFTGLYQQESFRPNFMKILRLCKAGSITTSLDTQWDSSETWADLDQWLKLVDYLFVNKDEAISITGMQNPDEAMSILKQQTVEVVIKIGPDGAVGTNGTQKLSVPSPDVEVIDTTGAGDTFAAGFLKKRIDAGADFLAAMKYASAAAAYSCTYTGGVNNTLCDAKVRQLIQKSRT